MITRESISVKLGFDPIGHDFGGRKNDWRCDGEETEDEKKLNLLSKDELGFLFNLAIEEAKKKKAERMMAAV